MKFQIRFFIGLVLALLQTLSFSGVSYAAEVRDVRLWRAPDHTRLVFDLSAPVNHKLIKLSNPDRLVIDIPRSQFKANVSKLDYKNSPIRGIRTGLRNGHDLRVVLDLNQATKPRSFVLGANKEYGDRLVIDLYDKLQKQTVKRAPSSSNNRRDIVVAIDAGHGGEDPGAIGPRRIQEKRVVLSIAKQLQQEFNQRKGYKAVLVREGDYYIGLKKRREIARAKQADLFVSIHADAFKDSRVRGGSVYTLSSRGASSATAAFLAEKENNADLVGGINLSDKDDLVAQVLTDLSMTGSRDVSMQIGKGVINHMGSVSRLHSSKVGHAAFAVLKSPDIPSILVETGFISNPSEAQMLAQPGYQRKMAKAIYRGVDQYFRAAPPPGTFLAWAKENGNRPAVRHLVKRGDTLSEIAQSYNVSMAELMRENGMKKTTLRLGQSLRIPAAGGAGRHANAEYVIVRGDTLSEIAQRYRVSAAAIRRQNGLASNSIRVGQKIIIPAS